MNKTKEKELLDRIEELTFEKQKLKDQLETVEELNVELQMRTKYTNERNDMNLRTIELQREKLEHYEKMFNYLTGGSNE